MHTKFDVIILGSGIAGSTMAAILSKQGLSTLMVDRAVHPRFALGESTIGETSFLLRLLGKRYDIPELGYISSSKSIQQRISKQCGIKRNFGFVYQRAEKEHDPFEVTQCNVSEGAYGPESHLMRSDIDAYLFEAAKRYGATALEGTKINGLSIDAESVSVTLSNGDTILGDYLVDATGRNSVLADHFGLREEPCRFKTQSRTLFTHMKRVKPYDAVDEPSGQPTLWHEGTLHHLFDGGWLWVIPFDNHEQSESDRVSVGLNLDCTKYPFDASVSPEEEWDAFLKRFPGIARQFEGAELAYPWVRTDRTQYSSTKTVGDRWVLMNHAAGAIDAMFSRGLANTMAVIEALVPRLLRAFADKNFSEEQFQYIEKLNQNILNNNDQLIAGSYISFRHFNLWRAWSKVWFLMWNLGVMRYAGTYYRFIETEDLTLLDALHQSGVPGAFCPEIPEAQEQFDLCFAVMQRVKEGTLSSEEAVIHLSQILESGKASLAPLNLKDVLRRWHDGSEESQLALHTWGQQFAPAEIRHFFEYDHATIEKAADSLVMNVFA